MVMILLLQAVEIVITMLVLLVQVVMRQLQLYLLMMVKEIKVIVYNNPVSSKVYGIIGLCLIN